MISNFFLWASSFISAVILKFGYVGIFFITILENIIAPIPSEAVFPWSGFLASEGKLSIMKISLSGAFGSLVGALILYYVGYLLSKEGFLKLVEKYGKYVYIRNKDIAKSEEWFEKYGNIAVFIGRFIPIIRSLISIPAGFAKMNLLVFSALTFVGTFIWSFTLTYFGFVLGDNWEEVVSYTSEYEKVVLASIAVFSFLFIGKRLKKKVKLAD